jgi:hypothetical protein
VGFPGPRFRAHSYRATFFLFPIHAAQATESCYLTQPIGVWGVPCSARHAAVVGRRIKRAKQKNACFS